MGTFQRINILFATMLGWKSNPQYTDSQSVASTNFASATLGGSEGNRTPT